MDQNNNQTEFDSLESTLQHQPSEQANEEQPIKQAAVLEDSDHETNAFDAAQNRSYTYSWQRSAQQDDPPEFLRQFEQEDESNTGSAKKEKRIKSVWGRRVGAAVLCLAFTLAGAAGGYSIALGNQQGSTEQSSGSLGIQSGSSLLGSSDEEKTANGIYSLACQQAVGITADITSTNIFGQQTSASVSGTGFVLTSDGYIMTNYHVIEDAQAEQSTITVMFNDGTKYTATVVGYEEDNDIAVLKINATGLTPVTIGDSANMAVGDKIYVVGNPLGELTYTMTSGIISALDREISTDANTTINMFQVDAAVNSGNSGGPVYNTSGEVVGIVTAKYASTGVEGLGFAILINDAVDIATQLIDKGYVSGKAYLGVSVTSVTSRDAQLYNLTEGAYVSAISSDSCAAKAGLKQGDIITQFNGTTIASASDLVAAKKKCKAGDTVSMTVWRSGETLTFSVTLDEETQEQQTQSSNQTQQSTTSSGSAPFFSSGSSGSTSGFPYAG